MYGFMYASALSFNSVNACPTMLYPSLNFYRIKKEFEKTACFLEDFGIKIGLNIK